jgi:hypothetical protein
MAFIHVINGLNGDIIKWRKPELGVKIGSRDVLFLSLQINDSNLK